MESSVAESRPRSMSPPLPIVGTVPRDTLVIARRNIRHMYREPQILVFALIQPVMLVLLFNFVFGGAFESILPPGTKYIDFVLPGIMVQVVAFGTAQTAVGMAQDLQEGIIDRFRVLPMARSAVLAGRVLSDSVRAALTLAVVTLVGLALGFRFADGVAAAALAYALLLSFAVALSLIAATIGMAVKSTEAAQAAGFVWLFPLTFASSAFVQTETFDPWLKAFAEVNPVTLFADSVRSLTLSGEPFAFEPATLLQALAWAVGIVAVFGPLAVYRYRRAS